MGSSFEDTSWVNPLYIQYRVDPEKSGKRQNYKCVFNDRTIRTPRTYSNTVPITEEKRVENVHRGPGYYDNPHDGRVAPSHLIRGEAREKRFKNWWRQAINRNKRELVNSNAVERIHDAQSVKMHPKETNGGKEVSVAVTDYMNERLVATMHRTELAETSGGQSQQNISGHPDHDQSVGGETIPSKQIADEAEFAALPLEQRLDALRLQLYPPN